MSNFTLEELCIIYQTLEFESEAVTEELLDKIVHLIENYCDHTWSMGSGRTPFCAKCQLNA